VTAHHTEELSDAERATAAITFCLQPLGSVPEQLQLPKKFIRTARLLSILQVNRCSALLHSALVLPLAACWLLEIFLCSCLGADSDVFACLFSYIHAWLRC
jgi:hypothetical protein